MFGLETGDCHIKTSKLLQREKMLHNQGPWAEAEQGARGVAGGAPGRARAACVQQGRGEKLRAWWSQPQGECSVGEDTARPFTPPGRLAPGRAPRGASFLLAEGQVVGI